MNEQLSEKIDESANNVRAIKTAARATHVAQYGEETATFVEGLIDLSFRTGALMAMMQNAPGGSADHDHHAADRSLR